MNKIRILWCGESALLHTGYAVYAREVLSRLATVEGLDIAELACYINKEDSRIPQVPWRVYPNHPTGKSQEEINRFQSSAFNAFGAWSFESVCLDFKPHIVCDIRDFWMLSYQDTSPFRPYYKWLIMPTVDSYPQNEEWLSTYMRADGVFTYQDWSAETLKKESGGRIKFLDSAPPCASPNFKPMDNRKDIKNKLGFGNKIIVGTVMRNQRRKLYPNLFKAFRQFLDETGDQKINLYCHTSYPDNCGWNLPKLVNDYRLGSRVLFTFMCRKCNQAFPSLFLGPLINCKKCGSLSATMCNTSHGIDNQMLNVLYNSFDFYVQYANSEGFGMPQVEAAAAGTPVMAVDFSGMSDVAKKVGWPIKVLTEELEIETGCYRAIPDNNDFINKLKVISKMSTEDFDTLRIETRRKFEKYYNWDETANKWLKAIVGLVNPDAGNNLWKQPPRISNPNTQIPNGLSNSEFAKWLIVEVLREPERLNTYMESRLIRDLNYGMSGALVGGMYYNESSYIFSGPSQREFNREIAFKLMLELCNRRNMWERERVNRG